jgi:hypothetical protein
VVLTAAEWDCLPVGFHTSGIPHPLSYFRVHAKYCRISNTDLSPRNVLINYGYLQLVVSFLIPAVCYCSRRHIYSMYPVHPLTQPQMLSPSLRMGATHPDDPRCGHPLQAKLGASPLLLPNLAAPKTIVVTPANVITAASKLPFPRTQTPTAYTPLARSQRLSMGLCHCLSFA